MSVGSSEVVLSGSLLLAFPLALLAGLVSFLSPCVLPLAPAYLGYVAGVAGNRTRVLAGAMLFVCGFTVVFVGLGFIAGASGLLLLNQNRWFQVFLGSLVVVMGLVLIGRFSIFQKTIRIPIKPSTGVLGAPLLGMIFALGWTPCIGPTLSAVLTLASGTGDPARGALLAVSYSLGLGLPFIALAAGLNWATVATTWARKHLRILNIIGGTLLIALGILIASGLWDLLVSQLQVVISGYQLPI